MVYRIYSSLPYYLPGESSLLSFSYRIMYLDYVMNIIRLPPLQRTRKVV